MKYSIIIGLSIIQIGSFCSAMETEERLVKIPSQSSYVRKAFCYTVGAAACFGLEYGINTVMLNCENGERHHWIGYEKLPLYCHDQSQNILNWVGPIIWGFGVISLWKVGKNAAQSCFLFCQKRLQSADKNK